MILHWADDFDYIYAFLRWSVGTRVKVGNVFMGSRFILGRGL